eukprot:TRINITY_DN1165_c2_g1_i1.p1 TRINITY_DN1165_c2_g1~~TRINITY_DN1165_c2_g1_i1.p1  ORF type:complete len:381 (+),score=76.47 TRINITY_DN1165_c2_g1_i1:55-1197(+)
MTQLMNTMKPRIVEVVVCTPWYPEGISKSEVGLENEIDVFAKFVTLTKPEMDRRGAIIDRLQAVCSGKVRGYGSYSYGTMTGSSAVDVCVSNLGSVTDLRNTMEQLLSAADFPPSQSLMTPSPEMGFAQVDFGEFNANITFYCGDCIEPTQSANFVGRCVTESLNNSVLKVHTILRQVLSQTGNLDVATGGLSAYALLLMIIAVDRSCNYKQPVKLLLEVCRYYGLECDFASCKISGNGIEQREAQHGYHQHIFVADPATGVNVAQDCGRLFTIRTQFQHCFQALQRWHESPSSKKGYKGRTPLSGIISHQKLWSRSDLLKEEAAGVGSSSSEGEEPPHSIAALFAVTSYDSLCSLEDDDDNLDDILKASFDGFNMLDFE